MDQPLLITLKDGKEVILNERQVTSVEPQGDGGCVVYLSDGRQYDVVKPPYAAWLNDIILRKS